MVDFHVFVIDELNLNLFKDDTYLELFKLSNYIIFLWISVLSFISNKPIEQILLYLGITTTKYKSR